MVSTCWNVELGTFSLAMISLSKTRYATGIDTATGQINSHTGAYWACFDTFLTTSNVTRGFVALPFLSSYNCFRLDDFIAFVAFTLSSVASISVVALLFVGDATSRSSCSISLPSCAKTLFCNSHRIFSSNSVRRSLIQKSFSNESSLHRTEMTLECQRKAFLSYLCSFLSPIDRCFVMQTNNRTVLTQRKIFSCETNFLSWKIFQVAVRWWKIALCLPPIDKR